jgi:F-type H+-transporting ATPase subunit epsilon
MHITVISPEKAIFDGDAASVTAPAFDGLVGILPGHAPFMTLLGEGALTVQGVGETHAFQVQRGFLQVVDDNIRVVTEQATEQEKE